MMERLGSFRLRFLIPFILLVYALLLFLDTFLVELPALSNEVESEARHELIQMLTHQQGTFDRLFRTKNRSAILQEISFMGAREAYRLVLILDDRRQVIASSQYSLKRTFMRESLSNATWSLMARAAAQGRGMTRSDSEAHTITAVFPLLLGPDENLNRNRRGFLIVEYDYGLRYKQLEQLIYTHLGMVMGLLLIVSLLLWFFFYWVLTRPVESLVSGSVRLASGDFETRVHTGGAGELVELGEAFNTMAESLGRYHADLLASEKRFRELMENVGTGVVVHAPDTTILEANKTASRILGLTREQMLGKEVIDPAWYFLDENEERLPLEEYPVVRVLEHRQPFENQVLGISDPNREKTAWVLVNGVPEFDDDGNLRRILISFSDISERKAVQKELAKSEAIHNTMIETLGEGVVLQGTDGAIIAGNEAAEEILGLTRDQMAGRTSLDPGWKAVREDGSPFPGEEHPAMVTLATGRPQQNVIMGVHKPSGELTWININSRPVMDKTGGNPRAVVVSFIDITLQREMYRKLEANRRYLRLLLDSQPNMVIINSGDELLDANRAFFDFFDRYGDVAAFHKEHRCVCELFEPTDRPDYLLPDPDGKVWVRRLKEERGVLHKVQISKGGVPHVFAIHLKEIDLGDGIHHNIVTFVDITKLEAYQRGLEERVEEEVVLRREQEVQLLQQAKVAQMGEMITNISHHWRQPLNLIGLNIQDILDAYDFGELDREYLEENVREAMDTLTKMSATIDNFREMIVGGGKKEAFDAAVLLKRTAELIDSGLKSHFIELETGFEEGLWLNGDKTLLEQTINNIVINAQEALIERKCQDRRIVMRLSRDENQAKIVLEDTAGGISEAVMVRLFEPFYTTKELSTKTGTGLYFSKMFVENEFGGTIHVENTDDGARFTIMLPLTDEPERKE